VGMMADIFLGWIGQKLFYIILCVWKRRRQLRGDHRGLC
jgi:hypothetical protein